MAHGLELRICLRLRRLLAVSYDYQARARTVTTDDIRCSTEGSAGVVLRDLRKEMSPGASGVIPCAILLAGWLAEREGEKVAAHAKGGLARCGVDAIGGCLTGRAGASYCFSPLSSVP